MRPFVLCLAIVGLLFGFSAAEAAPANTCVFVVQMSSGVNVNNMDFTVNYTGSDGDVEGTGSRPDCVNALNGQAFVGFHDDDAAKQLSVSIIRLTQFSAPVDLIGCRFFYDSLEPIPADFTFNVSNAGRDGEDNNVVPKPILTISSVECPGQLPSPTTTTTHPDTTTTTLVGAGDCGFPVSGGDKPTASDALFALKAAVDVTQCPLCVCDINSSGSVAAGDALGILKAAVGVEVVLDCPAC